ncbi:MAG: class I SAM-dependent methyltransferase [Actinomycetota bacterium]
MTISEPERAGHRYESIGAGYATSRQADPRIAQQLLDAIGDAETVLNVGAGSGNYEPEDRRTLAVEPSPTMLAQRAGTVPVVRAVAEHLPVASDSFDVATAIFTVHHWTDRAAGLQELGRVARRQVCLVYDTEVTFQMWLLHYFPELATAPWEVDAPDAEAIGQHLSVDEVRTVWVPPDCRDGFTGAFWNRPERYLEPAVQAGMSTLAMLERDARAAGTERLADALASGAWDREHGHLRSADRFDMGYRLVLSRRPA